MDIPKEKKHTTDVLLVQKHQIDNTQLKINEIENVFIEINSEIEIFDNFLDKVNQLVDSNHLRSSSTLDELLGELQSSKEDRTLHNKTLQHIDYINFNKEMSFDELHKVSVKYAEKHNIDLDCKDPFDELLSLSQKKEIQQRIKDDFTYKNAKCDKYDYMIASTCGLISGLIDILFVGVPGSSFLGKMVDDQANRITEKFASLMGWNKEKVIEKGGNTTASAIGFLEKKFKVNYDQATSHSTDNLVDHLSLNNHHLKSLAHSPDIIGLFFSILNQFTNTASFISTGKLITIKTENFELQGHNFIAKIFCGMANWFGHIMSDWTGSSGTVGQGRRGSGVPIPFFNLFQLMNFGEFGKHKQTFATITTKVFEEGYDARHGITMAVPVIINELLIRLIYTIKSKYYHNKTWNESLPKGSSPEVRRMLLVGHGALCLIDGADAALRSGGNIIQMLSRMNLIAWTRFSYIALKEVNAIYKQGHINSELVDDYLNSEIKLLLNYKY
ncbi:hypothetical protein [Gilliamella sp. Gris1-4]|jgi:hypothetical protein|uniref:hypothetical protein n=1 Tax=Gilliamella sp. Gris1-4 TaxID=3120244 RepID=UPI000A47E539|nr:hypothetical protein [Gilliamella apicola]